MTWLRRVVAGAEDEQVGVRVLLELFGEPLLGFLEGL